MLKELMVFHFRIIVALGLLAAALPGGSYAGDVQERLLEITLKKTGLKEQDAKQIANATDVVLEAAREFARNAVTKKPGSPVSSMPNPVQPFIALALDMDTIACASLKIALNRSLLALSQRTNLRSLTPEESNLWSKLMALKDALERGCDFSESGKAEKKPPPAHSTGATPEAEAKDIDAKPEFPPDWTRKDIACFESCKPSYNNYVIRIRGNLARMKRLLEQQGKKMGRLLKSQRERHKGQIVDCATYFAPILKAQKKYREILDQLDDIIGRMDRIYRDGVLSCIKTCSKRVQITLNKRFPRTQLHLYLEDLVAKLKSAPLISACSGRTEIR